MAGWMKTPLGTEVDLGSGHIVLDGVPAPANGALQSPLFGRCLLWPRSPISATAELLLRILSVNDCLILRVFDAARVQDQDETWPIDAPGNPKLRGLIPGA